MLLCFALSQNVSVNVSNFRLIILITCFYKITGKTLWLNKVMGLLVSIEQSAVVKWRQVLDSILIENEAVDDYVLLGKRG